MLEFSIDSGARIFILVSIVAVSGCRDPYTPPVIKGGNNYLVVGGFLNSGGATNITLSRTRALNDTTPVPENSAQVSVIGSAGDVFFLTASGNGLYTYDSMVLNPFETYQLQILTSNGGKYLSDTVSVFQTPPIDSLNWNQDSTGGPGKQGVNIYVNTHDNSTPYGYYRWEYEETWQYQAAYESYFTWDRNQMIKVARAPEDQVYNCWQNKLSTTLVVGNTRQLSQNLIYEQPVVFIPVGSQKLSVRYSVLVKQYNISAEAFDYWKNLQALTDLTGSIFDPLPSQVTGNIHNAANASEPVMGYISACAAQEKRLFISYHEVSHWGYQIEGCEELVLTPDQFADYFGTRGYYITGNKGIVNLGATTSVCADCRLQGGSNKQPAFW
ncbi:MAG: DUF4249 domain-containing protein [Chitinophagales bacterium]